jgi:hypothetical protein
VAPAALPPAPLFAESPGDGAARGAEAAIAPFSLEGLIRDERGVHFAPEVAD